MKSTTVLLADGKRVSWFNVSYVQFKKTQDGYQFTVFWKYKSSIKSETFNSTMQDNEINKYFARFGFVVLEDYYINLSKIMIVTENQIYGPLEKTKFQLIFIDGLTLNKTQESTKWSWWKSTYM